MNNPLKYVDPSGHDALVNTINVEDMDAFVDDPSKYMMVAGFSTGTMAQNDTMQLYDTWCDVRKANPKLSEFIEDSEIKVYYRFADLGGDTEGFQYGVTIPHGASLEDLSVLGTATDIDVLINESTTFSGIWSAIALHESWHTGYRITEKMYGGATSWTKCSYVDEAFAQSFGFWGGVKLGYSIRDLSVTGDCLTINPYLPDNVLSDQLNNARTAIDNVYNPDSWAYWPQMGKNAYLDYAKEFWYW